MPKAILIVVSDGIGGYGDFLFALKLGDQLKKRYQDQYAKELPVYIVTQPSGQEKIHALGGDREFGVPILTPDELQTKINAEEIDIGHIIEGPVFQGELIENIDRLLANTSAPIPLTMISEYSVHNVAKDALEFHEALLKNIQHYKTIFSGFDMDNDEHGILLSDSLLNPPNSALLAQTLEDNLRLALFGAEDITDYQGSTELYLQYSHDDIPDVVGPRAADHFLKIHREFVRGSNKNQDILMVGPSSYDKGLALNKITPKLIQDGFQRITLYDADTKTESVFHDSNNVGKNYRVIYTATMPHESMIACIALSGKLMGATGDQSLGEALSNDKIIIYECLEHKQDLIKAYDLAITKASGNNPDIQKTFKFLRKELNDIQYERLGVLLRNPDVQQQLAELNKSVLQQYDLVKKVLDDGLGLNSDLQEDKSENTTFGLL